MSERLHAGEDRPAGERDTFEDWAAANSLRLSQFALLVVGNHADAEDALQDALARAYERWDRITRTNDPHAYVRRMIINSHISWWRRTRRRELPVADLNQVADWSLREEAESEIWKLCLELPKRQRAAVVLRYFENLSYDEVAAVLQISTGTARSQTMRGLRKLRERLEDER